MTCLTRSEPQTHAGHLAKLDFYNREKKKNTHNPYAHMHEKNNNNNNT